jgi:hypothetical protein
MRSKVKTRHEAKLTNDLNKGLVLMPGMVKTVSEGVLGTMVTLLPGLGYIDRNQDPGVLAYRGKEDTSTLAYSQKVTNQVRLCRSPV